MVNVPSMITAMPAKTVDVIVKWVSVSRPM